MAEAKPKEPEPVSEFLRLLIDRWEQSGKKLYQLAAEAKLAKSMPSQIKAKTSDASFYSASRLAKPLGFTDLPTLVNAAYVWWRSKDRSQVPAGDPAPARTEAIAWALEHGVTEAQVKRTLNRYPLEEFVDQDALWWLSRFHEERGLDRQIAGLEGAKAHLEGWETKRAKTSAQAAWRARVAQSQDEPAPAADAAPKKKSKRPRKAG